MNVGSGNPMRVTRTHKCQTKDCHQPAIAWVSKDGTNKHVCFSCQKILVADKWKVINW
jgi:hypothetical protein